MIYLKGDENLSTMETDGARLVHFITTTHTGVSTIPKEPNIHSIGRILLLIKEKRGLMYAQIDLNVIANQINANGVN
jgi:hypothetical protein